MTCSITISPKALSRDNEVYWKYAVEHMLSLFPHFCVYERADKQSRLHLHGVIKVSRENISLFHDKSGIIGFCFFSRNPKKQWYEYLFKGPPEYEVFRVGPHVRSTNEFDGWFSDYTEADPMIDTTGVGLPPPQTPGVNEDQDLNLAQEVKELFD